MIKDGSIEHLLAIDEFEILTHENCYTVAPIYAHKIIDKKDKKTILKDGKYLFMSNLIKPKDTGKISINCIVNIIQPTVIAIFRNDKLIYSTEFDGLPEGELHAKEFKCVDVIKKPAIYRIYIGRPKSSNSIDACIAGIHVQFMEWKITYKSDKQIKNTGQNKPTKQ